MVSAFDRILAIANDDDRSAEEAKLAAFRIFLMVHVTMRIWMWVEYAGGSMPIKLAIAIPISIGAVASFFSRTSRLGVALVAAALIVKLVWMFPFTSNHFFIEVLFTFFLCAFDVRRSEDRALLLQGYRWMTAIILFYTGFQKLLYGTYFHGDYLGYQIAGVDHFADVFKHVMSSGEFERLRGIKRTMEPVSTGPYRPDSIALVILSNAAYIGEMSLAIALMVRRTRHLAIFGVIALVIGIEAAAHELMFGALFINAVLLFATPAWNRKALPVFGLLYLFLLGVKLGIFPHFWFN